jgi:hypothetical protein
VFHKWSKSQTDLHLYDLSNARHSESDFSEVIFGGLTDAEFAGCTFEKCTFQASSGHNNPNLKSLLFYECEFRQASFDDVHLEDVKFVKCTFKEAPTFANALSTGRVEIKQSGNAETFKNLPDLDISLGETSWLDTDIVAAPWLGLDWSKVAVLKRLPFLQVSIVGLMLLTLNALVLDVAGAASQSFVEWCRGIARDGLPGSASEAYCTTASGSQILESANWSVLWTLAIFLSLFLGSFIHAVACPAEVGEMTENQWRIEHRRPRLFHQLLAGRRPKLLYASLVFYATGGSLFLIGFIGRIVSIAQTLR